MPVRGPMLLHRMALVSFRLFCKNLGNLQEFFGQMVYRPPWPKIARTPMLWIMLQLFTCSILLSLSNFSVAEMYNCMLLSERQCLCTVN